MSKQANTRYVDILLSTIGLVIFLPLMAIMLIVCTVDTGSPIFIQKRMGRYKKPFLMVKFRTMKVGTPILPTHHLSASCISSLGASIRKFKLDEILQLFNVLYGHMSIVGPRPCLLSQTEIIEKRSLLGLYDFRPGVTGLAQINQIDMSMVDAMVKLDKELMSEMNLKNYFKIIKKTVIYIIR